MEIETNDCAPERLYSICPHEIISHIMSYLTPEAKMAFCFADSSIGNLVLVESDVKTALRNNDIVNLQRLSQTVFPIDKETYKLACASGIMEFIKLLEKREPKTIKLYATGRHGIDQGHIIISSNGKKTMEKYIQESGDQEMQVLLDKMKIVN